MKPLLLIISLFVMCVNTVSANMHNVPWVTMRQIECLPTQSMVDALKAMDETDMEMLGYVDTGIPDIEVLLVKTSNPNTGSFTVLETGSNGMSCVISGGNNNNIRSPSVMRSPAKVQSID